MSTKFKTIKYSTAANIDLVIKSLLISLITIIIIASFDIVLSLQPPGRTNLNYQIADYYGSRILGKFIKYVI